MMKKQYDYAMIYLASGRVVLTNEFTHSGDIIIIKPLVKLRWSFNNRRNN